MGGLSTSYSRDASGGHIPSIASPETDSGGDTYSDGLADEVILNAGAESGFGGGPFKQNDVELLSDSAGSAAQGVTAFSAEGRGATVHWQAALRSFTPMDQFPTAMHAGECVFQGYAVSS